MAEATKGIDFQSDGAADAGFFVERVEGTEELSRPYRFEIDLLSPKKDLKLEDVVRKPARLSVKVPVPGGDGRRMKTVKIHGAVETFEVLDQVHERVRYHAVLVSRFWKFSLNVRSRVFLDKDVKGVLKEVLEADAGGKKLFTSDDYELKLTRSYPKREYVVQYQETDLDFLSRWLEHEGIYYYFKQEDDRDVVVFADDPAAYATMSGDPELAYRPTTEGRSRAAGAEDASTKTEECVQAFVGRQSRVPAKVVLNDWNYRAPGTALKVEETADSADEGVVYRYGEHYKDSGEGKALAKLRAEEIRCRQKTFHGSSDCRSLRAGVKFPLAKHFRFDGKYLVTKVTHHFEQRASQGGTEGALEYRNEFDAIPAELPFRPERKTAWPRIAGYTTGLVDAGGDGKYAELDADGRYKVKLQMDLGDLKDGNASRWIRMAQPYTGADFGWHSPLHKGAEVAMGHADGDPDRPIIVGSVPNPNQPSMVKSANQSQCEWKSAGNNEIRYEDQEGSEQIYVHAQKDRSIVVENDDTEAVKHDQKIDVTNDRTKKVGGFQKEHIVKDKTITVDGAHTETITKDKTLTVSGAHTETIAKATTISIGEALSVTVGQAAEETVGAGKSVTVGTNFTTTVGAGLELAVGGAAAEQVGGAKEITVGGAMDTTVGGAKSENVGGESSVNVGKKYELTVNEDATIKAKKIVIEGEDEITIKSGSAKIVLKKSGDIMIEGKKIQVKGSGDVILKGSKIAQN